MDNIACPWPHNGQVTVVLHHAKVAVPAAHQHSPLAEMLAVFAQRSGPTQDHVLTFAQTDAARFAMAGASVAVSLADLASLADDFTLLPVPQSFDVPHSRRVLRRSAPSRSSDSFPSPSAHAPPERARAGPSLPGRAGLSSAVLSTPNHHHFAHVQTPNHPPHSCLHRRRAVVARRRSPQVKLSENERWPAITVKPWRADSLDRFRQAAALGDRHYRLGALPIPTYTELQKQYLDALDALLGTQEDALSSRSELERLTALDFTGTVPASATVSTSKTR